jgi:hypothetical protein
VYAPTVASNYWRRGYPLYQAGFTKTILYNYGLLLFNDVLIRLFAGGVHDDEGKGFIALFSFTAFIIATLVMILYAYKARRVRMTLMSAVAACMIYFVIQYI